MLPLQRALQAYYAFKNHNMFVEIWVDQDPTVVIDYDLYKIEFTFYKRSYKKQKLVATEIDPTVRDYQTIDTSFHKYGN